MQTSLLNYFHWLSWQGTYSLRRYQYIIMLWIYFDGLFDCNRWYNDDDHLSALLFFIYLLSHSSDAMVMVFFLHFFRYNIKLDCLFFFFLRLIRCWVCLCLVDLSLSVCIFH